MFALKEIDGKVLDELQRDSRRSLRKLSKKLGISINTLSKRIDMLEKGGIIEGYSVRINPEKLGFEMTAITEIIASKGKLVEAENIISKKKGVLAVYDITGKSDAVVISRFKKRADLNRFIKSLLSMECIERTNTHVVLNIIKEDFRIV
ncbi:MAG: Lrp/AsnC family transcriptional regulator [Candidatus Micrarchaeota archaeon]|nr:Lrp/AsnC family transcriptional regulator [Candidatus Micrarchaeota archaeon]